MTTRLPRQAGDRAIEGPPAGGSNCAVICIADPIVLGASFGGMIALSYATRLRLTRPSWCHQHLTAAGGSYVERRVELFERFGGPEAGALAGNSWNCGGIRTRRRSMHGGG